MAANPNHVTITGNITRDPEVKITGNGTTLTTFSIANNRSYKDRNDEWVEETSYFDVTTWAQLAEDCGEILEKGLRVSVTGRLKQDTWETPEGDKRSKVGIVAESVDISVSAVSSITRKQREGGNNGGGGRPAPQRQQTADDPF